MGWPKSSFGISEHLTEKHKYFGQPNGMKLGSVGLPNLLGTTSYIVMELGLNPGVILQVSGSQQGVVLFPGTICEMSGCFCCHNWRKVLMASSGVEMIQNFLQCRRQPHNRELSGPKCPAVPRLRSLAVQLQLLATVLKVLNHH